MRRGALASVAFLCLLGCEAEAPGEPAVPAPLPASRASAPAALAAGAVRVTRHASGYSVLAQEALPFEVLSALGEAAGFRAERAADAPSGAPLRLALEAVPVEDALAAILAGLPHEVHYEFADGDPSPERPFDGRPVVLARVRIGTLAEAFGEAETAPAPADPGRRGPPPRAERGRSEKRAERGRSEKRAGGGEDPERARQREEAETRERERAEKVARQWNDARASARLEAVELMQPEGEDRARLETLLREDPSPEVRTEAAEVLAEGDAFLVMEGLLAGLGDPDPGVVSAVVHGLEDVYGDAPNPRIRERVAELREHRDPGVREAVAAFEEWIEE